MEALQFADPGDHIPSWRQRGIRHGFYGRLDTKPDPMFAPKQVHGTHILELDRSSKPSEVANVSADGVAASSNVGPLGIQTADCVPILVYDRDVTMAIHGGWRGLVQGIVAEAMTRIRDKSSVWVAIGPHIQANAYEVGPDVMERLSSFLSDKSFDEAWVLIKGNRDRWFLDIGSLTCLLLAEEGVPPEQITWMRDCTFVNKNRWHSYRRDGVSSGRNWSWIQGAEAP